jgi:hypothetical protein
MMSISINVNGGRDFAEAFRQVNQIVNGNQITPVTEISASPRDGMICINIDPSQLTVQQQQDLMLWRLSWGGSGCA